MMKITKQQIKNFIANKDLSDYTEFYSDYFHNRNEELNFATNLFYENQLEFSKIKFKIINKK